MYFLLGAEEDHGSRVVESGIQNLSSFESCWMVVGVALVLLLASQVERVATDLTCLKHYREGTELVDIPHEEAQMEPVAPCVWEEVFLAGVVPAQDVAPTPLYQLGQHLDAVLGFWIGNDHFFLLGLAIDRLLENKIV